MDCWGSCRSIMRGARRDSRARSWCCSRTRTARCGTFRRLRPVAKRSSARSRWAAEGRIDWSEVAALYGQLARITRSPVVELNRAAAVAQAGSTEEALEMVEELALDDYQYLHSTRGELLRRLGRTEEAREAFQRALALARSEREQRFLERRIAEL